MIKLILSVIHYRWRGHPDILRRTSLQAGHSVRSGSSVRLCTSHEQLPLDRWTTQVTITLRTVTAGN